MNTETATATLGHNKPPVQLPKEEEMHGDLKSRYPEIEKGLGEHEKAFATYDGADGRPLELSLKDSDVAKALGDLISQAKKDRKSWKAFGTSEKAPLNKLVKVVTNFFTGADEKLEKLLARYEPVMEDFLAKQDAEAERLRQEEIERQRKKEEDARAAAAAELEKQRLAQEAAAAAREKERLAREAAEKAEADKKAAEEAAEATRAETARLEKVRRDNERAEKERNAVGIREARAYLKTAERMDQLAEAEEASPDELSSLEEHIRPRGLISTIMTPVATSPLLDDEQAAAVAELQNRLQALRGRQDGRSTKRAQRAAQKAAEQEQARLDALAAERKAARDAEDQLAADRKAARETAEAEEARLAQEKRDADKTAREAREAARGHEKDAKAAGKTADKAGDDADRAANRADRIEGRGEARHNVRGDLGSNSGLVRRWVHYVDDAAAIRTTLGPLGPHIALDAIEAAAFFWMRAHQAGFEGERVEPAELPGVRFSLEEDLASR